MFSNIMVFLFTKNIFLILMYIAVRATQMCNFENQDIDQMSSKFAQRWDFVCNFYCKKIFYTR